VLGEEGRSRSLHANRRPAGDRPEGDRVQIVEQYPPLRPLLLELGGELGLADLAGEVSLGILDVERAHQLLGDGRAPLHGLARFDVADAGSDDGAVVDPLVVVEALVLDGNGGVAQVLGHLAPGDTRADLIRLHVAEPRAVGGEDDRALALVYRLELAQRRGRGGHGEHVAGDREHGDGARQRDDAQAEQHLAAGAPAPALPELSLAMCHLSGGGCREASGSLD
jgi:hypothetical protein